MKLPRGLRNNNPLNIIKSDKITWQGEVRPSRDKNLNDVRTCSRSTESKQALLCTRSDATFCQFETMGMGCRATLKLLRTYYEKHKCNTISRIIRRWAPETENQVEAYIRTVSKLTGIGATTPLPPMKEETKVVWCDLVLAMATVECGLNSQGREELAPSIDVGWRLLNP